MFRTLLLIPLLLGAFAASSPASSPVSTVVNDDIRGTADGEIRVHRSGAGRLVGELRSEDGALVGRLFAEMNDNGTIAAIAVTPSGQIALTGTWDTSGFEIGTVLGNIEIEMEGSISARSWSGEWRVRRG